MPGARRWRRMAGFIALVVWLILAVWLVGAIRRRRTSIVSKRGMSVGADIGRLHDVPRVRVDEIAMTGPDAARLVLAAVDEGPASASEVEGTYTIWLNEQDPGFAQLHEWRDDGSVLGMVLPPESNLIRLRSIDDLQPLTLRRLDV